MGAFSLILLILLAIIVLVVLFFVAIYNKLIQLKNRFKNAFAQIDVQLKRRYDLIPNLVETAKGYLKHEREVLEAVIKARNQATAAAEKASADPGNTEAMQGLMGAESALTGTLGRLFALVEAYPDLKANQNMMQLSEELTATSKVPALPGVMGIIRARVFIIITEAAAAKGRSYPKEFKRK